MRFFKEIFFSVCLLGAVVLLHAATPADSSRRVVIQILPVFNGEKLVLENKNYFSPAGDTLLFERFRFYVSSLELVFQDGTRFRETNSYHLIDAGEMQTCELALTHVPKGKIVALKFNVGVDSVQSVSGALDGDLDPRLGMYWAWNSGYIHAKLEGRSPSCTAHQNRFEFHIGGYAFPENALRKIELDLSANKTGYFAGNRLSIVADAQSWFGGESLTRLQSVMNPGKQAMHIADNYSKMFKVWNEN